MERRTRKLFCDRGYVVEFGYQATSPVDVVIASANNISSANISVEFLSCSPDHRIVARGNSDTVQPPNVEFRFIQLAERAIDGSVVRTFNFSDATFFAQQRPPSKPSGAQQFDFVGITSSANSTINGTRISFRFTLFDDATVLPYADGTLSLPPSSVKWEMQVIGWPVPVEHALELDIDVSAAPSIVSMTESTET